MSARAPDPVYLKHMPREVAIELDRRYGLVENSGHVTVHKHDGEAVKYEHRDVGGPPPRLRSA